MDGSSIEVKEQPSKAPNPISVTLPFIVTLKRFSQPMNASPDITVTPSGMVTAARSVFAKAALFICVTVEGIENKKSPDSAKAHSPIY